ncbi:hypothetical protein RPE78_17515 (plasmid) [Thioclava litoralis]|uniref:Uncharacterized protein n=1 Tax=Thioclava litoralis TaxID=3076557 RepID=A0ABZ1E4L2_9RHOB|nr:hypothetical protein RPE78_17515 [Thioclava sp. FTW29]
MPQSAEQRRGRRRFLDAGHAGADGRALLLGVGTVVATPFAFTGNGHIAPALAASEQAGQQILPPTRSLRSTGPAFACRFRLGATVVDQVLLSLHALPEILLDDPQIGLFGNDPFLTRVRFGRTPTCLRMLVIAEPVPDLMADVEFVVQDAGAAGPVAIDGIGLPMAAPCAASTRGRDATEI